MKGLFEGWRRHIHEAETTQKSTRGVLDKASEKNMISGQDAQQSGVNIIDFDPLIFSAYIESGGMIPGNTVFEFAEKNSSTGARTFSTLCPGLRRLLSSSRNYCVSGVFFGPHEFGRRSAPESPEPRDLLSL